MAHLCATVVKLEFKMILQNVQHENAKMLLETPDYQMESTEGSEEAQSLKDKQP